MKLRTLIASVVLCGAASLFSPAASAASVVIRIGPPPPRAELVPGPRHGYVWIGGHWQWMHGRYVWAPGRFVPERYGYVYVTPRWEEWDSHWHYIPGYWSDHRHEFDGRRHDRDHRRNREHRHDP